MTRLLISSDPFILKAAKIEQDNLTVFVMKRKDKSASSIVGNVYKGIIENVAIQLGAAFVNIGLDKNAFLCLDKHCLESIRSLGIEIRENQEVMVQVLKPTVSAKGPKVSLNITIPGNYLVLLKGVDFVGVSKHISDKQKNKELRDMLSSLKEDDIGFIARTASRFASLEELEFEAHHLKKIARQIDKRYETAKAPSLIYEEPQLPLKVIREYCDDNTDEIIFDDIETFKKTTSYLQEMYNACKNKVKFYNGDKPIFEFFGIEDEIRQLQNNVVHLKSGGYLIIEKTEAFFAIDVNAGSYHYRDYNAEDAIFKVNLEAAYEVFNQINLRDLGGLIIVDFIDMNSQEHKKKIEDVLYKLAKDDKRKTYVSKMSELGVVEISRRKNNTDIFDEMFEKCPDCYNGGLVKSTSFICSEIYQKIKYSKKKKFRLKATPGVIEQLRKYVQFEDKKIDYKISGSCNAEEYVLEVLG
ncbi:Rne/Rng family ribonuclease [Hippea maritima]|uniref:Ribonuclease, Rne/Rng family n=1 Tax=Hippea maritima (strain ATCC 700847 / DSM 10411 / MH2) TaxID=760142 RepID=F2LTJ9_HIPMA|nr:Rne/Rng family ribonuclease [Hippea maritima]AEA33324.1 ribonuclease, Rne/Rng family [Hippea maritima DSM 10411]